MIDAYPRPLPPPDIIRLSSVDLDQARSMLNRFYYQIAVGAPGRRTTRRDSSPR